MEASAITGTARAINMVHQLSEEFKAEGELKLKAAQSGDGIDKYMNGD